MKKRIRISGVRGRTIWMRTVMLVFLALLVLGGFGVISLPETALAAMVWAVYLIAVHD